MSSYEAVVTLTPSLNVTKKFHHGATKRMRSRYGLELLAAVRGRPWSDWPKDQRRRVTVTRIGPKLLDHDNLYGGAKTLLDAMRDIGLLVDDSPKHCEPVYFQRVAGNGEAKCTLVRVEVLA